jgi:hypothetical protein
MFGCVGRMDVSMDGWMHRYIGKPHDIPPSLDFSGRQKRTRGAFRGAYYELYYDSYSLGGKGLAGCLDATTASLFDALPRRKGGRGDTGGRQGQDVKDTLHHHGCGWTGCCCCCLL